eukprot:TRINITY_DN19248_c0_g1_i1.p1 TRINITY_DN19248_c0_g1~~TRINITY_DN19248_c0_g1_i1.p1  ORF type:complete len:205 (-),score=18.12 TRINITY_DN19248_c0_g1_i1:173-697(-)
MEHPYEILLSQLLQKHPEHYEISVQGIPGERTYQMKSRLEIALQESEYDWVIILGGTNDLSVGDPAVILDNLTSMHRMSKESGAKSIVVTIPHVSSSSYPLHLIEKRKMINDELRKYAADQELPLADLEMHPDLTPNKDDEEHLKRIWDDTLHFTPQGYDEFAKVIYAAILPHL